MSTRFITADWIYPVSSPPVSMGVIVMEEDRIIEVTSRSRFSADLLEDYKGIIIPGFINTHCHLELSHLKGKAPTGTGLLPFLDYVVKLRDTDPEIIDAAIAEADAYMWAHGIQAVGDISNKADTFRVKQVSKIRYYSFVEMFDFLQNHQTDEMIRGYVEVYEKAPGLRSAVPHAPYTVSPALFNRINQFNASPVTVSLHNQETKAEDDFFRQGAGGFFDFYKNFGFDLSHFTPTGTSSLQYALNYLDPAQRTLLVHNTLSTPADIATAQMWNSEVYWATCPNANLYIENRMPNYQYFIDAGARMTIGTDSLTSNWQLSILEEMKTIAKYQSYIPFDILLQWATLNGAMALGLEDQIGSIEKGKNPGLLLLTMDPVKDRITDQHVEVKRLV